ncbi:MAG: NUDIX domain-containing protein [Candidatus Paceibacterota bacterium]
MPKEVSAGVVVFRKEGGNIYYLLLRYPAICHRAGVDYWDFVKGHIEAGESELETIVREAEEETGLRGLEFVEGFSQTMEYFFIHEGKKIFKSVSFRLAEASTKEIVLSDEHNDFAWLPYEQAYAALSFDNAKQVLEEADEHLEKLKM